MITEPTLERYAVYLRQVEGDTARAAAGRRAFFSAELAGLLAQIGHLSGQSIHLPEWTEESLGRRAGQLILSTGWLEGFVDGRSCFAAAHIYGDVYCLQVGYCQSGQAAAEVFGDLHSRAWQPADTPHLLGRSDYMCGIAADELDDLASRALATCAGHAPGEIVSTYLAESDVWLYGALDWPHVTVLFYPDAAREQEMGERILNRIAPRTEVYRHKATRQLAWSEGNIPVLAEQETALRDLLHRAEGAPPGDVEPLRQLVQLYRVYDGNAGMLADRQVTIGVNLDNLDVVLEELGPLAQDRFLSAMRGHLRGWERQLEVDLAQAGRARQRAGEAIRMLLAEQSLDHPGALRVEPDDEGSIGISGFPGAALAPEAEMALPAINVPADITLHGWEVDLLQYVYREYSQVEIEREFEGGYSGTRVLLALPQNANGRPTALRVVKIGPAAELRREMNNYREFVEDSLPFSTAPVEWYRFCEQGDQAGVSYYFVGRGMLGKTADLETYYHQASASGDAERVTATLDGLLGRELGPRWYEHCTEIPEHLYAVQYGRHLVEHLRLGLRPRSDDALWTAERPPLQMDGYRRVAAVEIPSLYETIRTGDLVEIEEMTVAKIRHGTVKLRDEQGAIVCVDLDPKGEMAGLPALGSAVGLRGQVVANRRERMEEITRAICPGIALAGERIELPDVPGTFPNPLRLYPWLLKRALPRSRTSCVHGDLHLRNVLVDEYGIGRLIDFAKVEKRHNLFDLVKLETYLRLMGLANAEPPFALADYVVLEKTLIAAAQGRSAEPPTHPRLWFAQRVVFDIRRIARAYVSQEVGLLGEYFPALFLYCLAVMKYYDPEFPRPTLLAFATACVLGQYVDVQEEH